MRDTPYFSVRTGTHPTGGRLDLAGLKRLVLTQYRKMESDGYFQQVFGFVCVDAGEVPGTAGPDVESFVFRKLLKPNLWPIEQFIDSYTESDLFDVIELLHDYAAKGVDGTHHGWGNCGWHYDTFDKRAGQNDLRIAMNEILGDYGPGYNLASDSKIAAIPPAGLGDLADAPDPPGDPIAVGARIKAARDKFRRRGSTVDDRRDAVRDLADVLEYLRPQARSVLHSKDEADLFNLANNFGIRHHNSKQQTSYDPAIWLSWAFYYYLATIHALTRLIERNR